MRNKNVWDIIGFTYHPHQKKYALIRVYSSEQNSHNSELCLSCTRCLHPDSSIFCFQCKAPRPPDWTTGNEFLDSLMMTSWKNVYSKADNYIQWVQFEQLNNIQEISDFEYTHTAEWIKETNTTGVLLKLIYGGEDAQSFDFYRVIKYLFVNN